MNKDLQDLIISLAVNQKSKEEFLNQAGIDALGVKEFAFGMLRECLRTKVPDDVELALIVCSKFEYLRDDSFFSMYCHLLEEDWHYRHEDLVMILERFEDDKAVEVIFNTAQKKFDYLEYDDAFALGVKCAWALFKIGSTTAIEKLRLLSGVDNPIIGKKATELLMKSHR